MLNRDHDNKVQQIKNSNIRIDFLVNARYG